MASDGDVSTFQANLQRSNSAETNSPPSALTPKSIEFPDCQFHNFDAWRSREMFQPGQIWAFYSGEDGLPRFYGQIMEIGTSPDLKLHIVWLGSCWLPNKTIRWKNKKMLISCGRFRTKTGNSNVYKNTDSVSHQVCVNFDAACGEYSIFPRKGEVWALYRKWTPKLKCSDLINWEYDIVEVIEENACWLEVLVLEFVHGYNSVFKCKTHGGSIVTRRIPLSQLLTFSHQIPAFKLADEDEEHGRLRDFWELDPGALPTYLQMSNSAKTNGSVNYVKYRSAPSALTPKYIEIPDSQFHNFDAWRSRKKFRPGQIWAFYSGEDGLPRYYGQIMEIGTSPDLELHIVWLDSCWLPKKTIKWKDQNMHISCGRFRTTTGNSNVYNNTDSFSHQVCFNFDAASGEYSIFPRKSEVWALYRKWTPKLKCSDLINWEYDIVEVIEVNALWLEVLVLEFVHGYNSVFKRKTHGGSIVTRKIQQSQLLTFSHEIPAFKLTDEEHGRLRGCWELDPGALPTYFWTSK